MKGYTPIILILVSVGLFFFYIEPLRERIDELNQERIEKETNIQKVKELRETRGILNEKYKNISKEDIARLSKVLPDTVDNVRLILDINNIASKYGIILKGISISGGPMAESGEINRNQGQNQTIDQSIGNIQFSFSFSTDYDVFKIFLKDLEESMRLIDITDITVSAGAEDKSGLYNYSLSLNTYWLR
jgi:Tfp pilus assembly protein PilO